MNQFDTTQLIAMAAALGWASGLRLYLVLTIVGLAGYTGWIELPAGLRLLQHPLVLGACSLMLFIEFFADKIPGLDTLWDLVHTAIRIPAGAALAAAVFGVDDAVLTLVAALLGGTLAATAHTAKATTRAAVNTSPCAGRWLSGGGSPRIRISRAVAAPMTASAAAAPAA